jgi:hypothetical protein
MRGQRRKFALIHHSGWVNNKDFTELTPEKAQSSINEKMRKDLKAAYELAAEGNSVDHYKEMLRGFQEDLIKRQEAEAAAAATPKKSKKSKAAEDEDVDMADAGESAKTKTKKRKADEETSVRHPGCIMWDCRTDTTCIRLLSAPTLLRSRRSSLTRRLHRKQPTEPALRRRKIRQPSLPRSRSRSRRMVQRRRRARTRTPR